LKIGVVCGGPSRVRGISLNSARSLVDHLGNDKVIVVPFFVDPDLRFHRLNRGQLYSKHAGGF
jgi:D-alanine-D-alanine ligase-like ATP-grasp enzyme